MKRTISKGLMLKIKKKSKRKFCSVSARVWKCKFILAAFWRVSGKNSFFAQAYKVEVKTVEDCHHTGRTAITQVEVNAPHGFITTVLNVFHFYYVGFYILKVFIPGVGASWSLSVYDSLSAWPMQCWFQSTEHGLQNFSSQKILV